MTERFTNIPGSPPNQEMLRNIFEPRPENAGRAVPSQANAARERTHSSILRANEHLQPSDDPVCLYASTPMFRKSGRDYSEITDSLKKVSSTIQARIDRKEARKDEAVASKESWCALVFKSRRTIGGLNDEIDSAKKLKSSVDQVRKRLENLVRAEDEYLEMRDLPLPSTMPELREHLDTLEAKAREIEYLQSELKPELQRALMSADQRRNFIKKSRAPDFFRRAIKSTGRFETIDRMKALLNTVSSDTKGKVLKTEGGAYSLNRQMIDEGTRIQNLRTRLTETYRDGGDEVLRETLAGSNGESIKTSVALDAIRGGEGIGQHLKNSIPESAVDKESIEFLGKGSFNKVKKAHIDFERPDGTHIKGDFALKLLDSNINTSPSVQKMGGTGKQVGIVNKQAVGHHVASALKSGSVGEPQTVTFEGRLHLAMPYEDGMAPGKMMREIAEDYGVEERQRVTSALSKNINLLDAVKDSQIFNTAINNPDCHRGNIKIRYFRPDDTENANSLTHHDLAAMKDDEIKQLKVEIGYFDLDNSMAPEKKVDQITRRILYYALAPDKPQPGYRHPVIDVPLRAHNYGLPAWHTAGDLERVTKLYEDLRSFESLQKLRPHTTRKEYTAMRNRVRRIKEHFEKHPQDRINKGASDPQKYNSPETEAMPDTLDARQARIKNTGYSFRFNGENHRGDNIYKPMRNFPLYMFLGTTEKDIQKYDQARLERDV
ncbi:MAG: hypothetical protein AAGG47_02365 [Pseudomonadota bacterium]